MMLEILAWFFLALAAYCLFAVLACPGGYIDIAVAAMVTAWKSKPAFRYCTIVAALLFLLGHDANGLIDAFIVVGLRIVNIIYAAGYLLAVVFVSLACFVAYVLVRLVQDAYKVLIGQAKHFFESDSLNVKERNSLAKQLSDSKKLLTKLRTAITKKNTANNDIYSAIQKLEMDIQLSGGRFFQSVEPRAQVNHAGCLPGLPHKVDGMSQSALVRYFTSQNKEVVIMKHTLANLAELIKVNEKAVERLETEEYSLELLKKERIDELRLLQEEHERYTKPRSSRRSRFVTPSPSSAPVRARGHLTPMTPYRQQPMFTGFLRKRTTQTATTKEQPSTAEPVTTKRAGNTSQDEPFVPFVVRARPRFTRERRDRSLSPARTPRPIRQRSDSPVNRHRSPPDTMMPDAPPLAPAPNRQYLDPRMAYEYQDVEELTGKLIGMSVECFAMDMDEEEKDQMIGQGAEPFQTQYQAFSALASAIAPIPVPASAPVAPSFALSGPVIPSPAPLFAFPPVSATFTPPTPVQQQDTVANPALPPVTPATFVTPSASVNNQSTPEVIKTTAPATVPALAPATAPALALNPVAVLAPNPSMIPEDTTATVPSPPDSPPTFPPVSPLVYEPITAAITPSAAEPRTPLPPSAPKKPAPVPPKASKGKQVAHTNAATPSEAGPSSSTAATTTATSAPPPADNPLALEKERDDIRPVTPELLVAAALAFRDQFVPKQLVDAGVHFTQVQQWQDGYEARLRASLVDYVQVNQRPPWPRNRAIGIIQSEFTRYWAERCQEEMEEIDPGSWERLRLERGKWLMKYLQRTTKVTQVLRPVGH